MATVIGILAQANPGAVLTDMYTVPALKHVTGRIIITNVSAGNLTFRIALSKNGDAIVNKHYVSFDVPIVANDTGSSIAVMLGAGAIVRVYGSTADVSFTLTGIEQDDV